MLNSNFIFQLIGNTSILSYALSLRHGEHRKIYIDGTVTDLPSESCKYSEATVCKLNNDYAQITIHSRASGAITYTNTFNGSKWLGWRGSISKDDLTPTFTLVGTFDDETNYSNRQPTGNSYYMTVGMICIVNITIVCKTPTTGNSYVTDVDKFPRPYNNKYAFSSFVDPNSDIPPILGGINQSGRLYFRRGKAGETYEGQIIYAI